MSVIVVMRIVVVVVVVAVTVSVTVRVIVIVVTLFRRGVIMIMIVLVVVVVITSLIGLDLGRLCRLRFQVDLRRTFSDLAGRRSMDAMRELEFVSIRMLQRDRNTDTL
jgi:hypothetical protein